MSVFRTKTIERILEPFSQQVSRLVIMHEKYENGYSIPDLSKPIDAVKMAIDNLVEVGQSMINGTATDLILKQDMFSTLNKLKTACFDLESANISIKENSHSEAGRRLLIDGARGILQGVSGLLLTFDESEVRKITNTGHAVIDYLSIADVVETVEDLMTFIKNMIPLLTKLIKQIEARKRELTHRHQCEMLDVNIQTIKSLTPTLINVLKKQLKSPSSSRLACLTVIDGVENAIWEIIDGIQLATCSNCEWPEEDDCILLRKSLLTMISTHITTNLMETMATNEDNKELHEQHFDAALCAMEKELSNISRISLPVSRAVLIEATRVIDRIDTTDPSVISFVDEIKNKYNDCAAEFQRLSQFTATERDENKAKQYISSKSLISKLMELRTLMDDLSLFFLSKTKRIRPSQYCQCRRIELQPTLQGKLQQARTLILHARNSSEQLGLDAIRLILLQANQVAEVCDSIFTKNIIQACTDVETILSKICPGGSSKNEGNDSELRSKLFQSLGDLEQTISSAIVYQMANDFTDIESPIKNLANVALSTSAASKKVNDINTAMDGFVNHSLSASESARLFALAGECRCKKAVVCICRNTQQIDDLVPLITAAARVLYSCSDNSAIREYFESLKDKWEKTLNSLREFLDDAVDAYKLIAAYEELIINDSQELEKAIADRIGSQVLYYANNIIKKSNRVIGVAENESKNYENEKFRDIIKSHCVSLYQACPRMLNEAKILATDIMNKGRHGKWQLENNKVIDAIASIREILAPPKYSDDNSACVIDQMDEEYLMTTRQLDEPTIVQSILVAGEDLYLESKEWPLQLSVITAVAQKIAISVLKYDLCLVRDISKLLRLRTFRPGAGSKKDLILAASSIADNVNELNEIMKVVCADCSNYRIRMNLMGLSESIVDYGIQIKILSAMKVTMNGANVTENEKQEVDGMIACVVQSLVEAIKDLIYTAKKTSFELKLKNYYKPSNTV